MKLRIMIILMATICCLKVSATDNTEVEYRDLIDKNEIYTFLFKKQFSLKNPNCHRQVHESRSPKTMIAMGCKLYRLEIDKSTVGSDKIQFKGHYQCGENHFPFTAHCYLK
jgi:hypothetical protein